MLNVANERIETNRMKEQEKKEIFGLQIEEEVSMEIKSDKEEIQVENERLNRFSNTGDLLYHVR
jgi:hypothetical protein